MYDARKGGLDLSSDYPYRNLPRYESELECGDFVWIGFHAHAYKKKFHATYQKKPEGQATISNDLMWVVLLSRAGKTALDIVTDPNY